MDDSLTLACSTEMKGMDEFDDTTLRTIANEGEGEEGALPANALSNLQSAGERVPPFLSKLYQIVSQPQTDHCVHWSTTGDSFVVADHHIFSKQVLPQFFKHSSLCSFIRQLNTYGFRKRTNMGSSSDQMEFFNENFRRGHIDLLSRIKRTGQSKGATRTPSQSNAPLRGPQAASVPPGVQIKQGGAVGMHATKSDLMHVQGQVNALISEVRDMRTLMHQYMMEVDKRVNLFSMEMHGAANRFPYGPNGAQGQGALGAGGMAGGGHGLPVSGAGNGQTFDPAAAASLAAMVSQPSM